MNAPIFKDNQLPQAGISHVVGSKESELWRRTIPNLLKDTVDRFSNREAVVFPEQEIRWTWSELDREVDALAHGLLELGLQKGDRVGIWSPNRYEWLLTQFATARIGIILVTINPAYRVSEVEFALNKVGCTALITASNFKTSDYIGMLQDLAPELSRCEPGALAATKLPSLKTVIRTGTETTPGMLNFDAVIESGRSRKSAPLDAISATLEPTDAINIQFTSGTTGTPKGATLSHINIVNNGRFVVRAQNMDEADRLCIPLPLYHCFGMVMGSLGCVTTGSAMVFPSEGFDPETCLRAISEEKCTSVYGVPTMFVGMLQHPKFKTFDFSALRTGIMAGAPCPIEVMKQCVSEMNLSDITIAYGMTETSPVSFQTSYNDPLERRVSTVGRVHPHVECKIIDENGKTVPPGTQGELCTRGYSVMIGYWEEPERTAESIDLDGWMHSGDLAVIDKDGYGNITGRVKDMVVRGGENIYPAEVENYLFRHPAIQEVQVFGVPDMKLGEEICAWIVLTSGKTATEEEIASFCRGQIAHYKIPRYIRFKSEIPLTVTGKPQKFKMRDAMIEELGIQEIETA
tara:strand:+ start:2018 stop:3742 length:1725 start_codon:yes stop_codon:yes gene_type:complete